MAVSLSAAFILAAVTGVLLWARRVSAFAALVIWLSGFTAAATTVAGPVRSLLTALVSSIH